MFFDTLLSQLHAAEVEAVLAHELGHFKLRHVVKRMAWGVMLSLGFFWLLSFLMRQDWFYQGLGVADALAGGRAAALLARPSALHVPVPARSGRCTRASTSSRPTSTPRATPRRATSCPRSIKLYKDNASTLTPDPLHSAFYDSHPPALARIARLQKA